LKFLHQVVTNHKNFDEVLNNSESSKTISKVYYKKEVRSKPVFSLIVPVYKEEKIIESHLNLFNEELRHKYNFELIVSDGGSEDDTALIAKQFADIVVIHDSKDRQTISQGRNRGADFATGDTFVFLNVDSIPADIVHFMEIITDFNNKTERYFNCHALACNVSGFPEEVLLKDKIFYFLHNNYVHFLNLIGLGMGRGECQIVRRTTFQDVSGYNDNIAAGEDFDLFRRISKIGKIKFIRDLLIYESPRRFRKYGYIKTIFYWTLNSLSVWCFGKSVSKEWEAVR
jgi:glycosyltransferase involved in cell wall biosynthesis